MFSRLIDMSLRLRARSDHSQSQHSISMSHYISRYLRAMRSSLLIALVRTILIFFRRLLTKLSINRYVIWNVCIFIFQNFVIKLITIITFEILDLHVLKIFLYSIVRDEDARVISTSSCWLLAIVELDIEVLELLRQFHHLVENDILLDE